MRWTLLTAAAIAAAALFSPVRAAEPETPAPAAAAETITFDQYREWRNRFNEQRQAQLAARLAATDLAPTQRARVQQQKSYYDWLAGLSEAERDRRYRERFDRIDANHDGKIDAAERAAWHDKQRAFYERRPRREAAARQPAAIREQ